MALSINEYHLPIGFRVLPDGPFVRITALQKRKLAAYWHEQRCKGRKVFMEQAKRETGIEQAQARKSEMLAAGFLVDTLPQDHRRKGDQRELFMLSECIELVWEHEEAGGGHVR